MDKLLRASNRVAFVEIVSHEGVECVQCPRKEKERKREEVLEKVLTGFSARFNDSPYD